jgi:hypothetical protein
MGGYAVAQLDEIEELDDGRCPWRPVRHHFGITAFGINAWTAGEAGARIINEHGESEPDASEELYLVLRDSCCEGAPCSSSTASVWRRPPVDLRQAINLSEQFRSYAEDDSDFAPIRDESAFKELIGA